jgi:hypothetical protein
LSVEAGRWVPHHQLSEGAGLDSAPPIPKHHLGFDP